jgi:hypothetical protein
MESESRNLFLECVLLEIETLIDRKRNDTQLLGGRGKMFISFIVDNI